MSRDLVSLRTQQSKLVLERTSVTANSNKGMWNGASLGVVTSNQFVLRIRMNQFRAVEPGALAVFYATPADNWQTEDGAEVGARRCDMYLCMYNTHSCRKCTYEALMEHSCRECKRCENALFSSDTWPCLPSCIRKGCNDNKKPDIQHQCWKW